MGHHPLVMSSSICSAPQSQLPLVDSPQCSMFTPNLLFSQTAITPKTYSQLIYSTLAIGYWPYIVEETKCVGQLLQSFTRRLSLAVYVEFSLAIFYLLHCTVYEKNNSKNTIPYRGILHLHVQNEFLHRVRGCLIRSQSQNPVAFSIFLTTRKRDVRHDKM